MKTKNILKIGIFSIALFALLISPALKTNIIKVNADDPDTDSAQSTTNQDISDIYMLGYGISTEDITTGLLEERANDICSEIDYDVIIENCAKNHDAVYRETICRAKASFAQIQCEFVIGILEGLGTMFGGIINSEIEWILNALNPATYGGIINDGVNAIWTVLRNIVNSLLVLGLIGIAIATILGYKKYAWKQILWKLILVALLVNFSLVISGIVVDTSNYLTGYFLSMSQENGSIAPRIMMGYGYTKDADTTNQYTSPSLFGSDKYKSTQINQEGATEEGVGKFTVGLGNAFIIAFITILTGGFAVIALLAIYLAIIVRNIFLIILLGLSSIAFAAWIFPDTEKYWKMWWSNFIKWCSFPVIFAFTLYLGLTVMNAMPPIDPNSSMAVTIIHMTLFSMFLIGGLIFSIQSGGVVSKTVLQQSSKIGAALGTWTAKTTTRGIEGSKVYRTAGQKLTQVPLLNKLGYNMLDKSDNARTTGDIKKREKEIGENRSKEQIMDIANGITPNRMNKKAYTDYMASRNIATKKGWLKNDAKAINSIRTDVRNNNPDLDVKAIANAFPQYFRIGKNGKLEELDQKASNYKEQVINNLKGMSPQDLPKKTENILKALTEEAGVSIDEVLEKLVCLKTNQVRGFFDNISEGEYNQGAVFGGTLTNPKPYAGPDGVVAATLRKRESNAINKHTKADAKLKANPTNAALKAKERSAYKKWVEIDNAINLLNQKLKTSNSLKETLGVPNV